MIFIAITVFFNLFKLFLLFLYKKVFIHRKFIVLLKI
nr:MAG TPA: hypothetical protein [Caudoviricetes sp.]